MFHSESVLKNDIIKINHFANKTQNQELTFVGESLTRTGTYPADIGQRRIRSLYVDEQTLCSLYNNKK